MNILIIGTGYLGRSAALHFKKLGAKVTGVTRHENKLKELEAFCDKSLLWNEKTYETAFTGQDIVLLSAAPSQASGDISQGYREAYLENAKRILKAAPHLKQILYTSSTSVYGDLQGADATEETEPQPGNSLQHILLDTEKLLQSSPRTTIFRLGELIGQGRTLEERLRVRQNLPFPGNGEGITNLSPLSDVISALSFAIQKPLFGLYNLVSDLHAPRKELYNQICTARNLPPVRFDPSVPSHHGGNKRVLSGKIKAAGFTFQAPITEGIVI